MAKAEISYQISSFL